ncbi:MAG: PAS domain S-box protein, partial [Magnetococcales bacterium]|nr:PAS domain S-box protein [Magnetococcales bacterium]
MAIPSLIDKPSHKGGDYAQWIVLLISVLATLLGWQMVHQVTLTRAENAFSAEVIRHKESIVDRLTYYEQALRSGVALQVVAGPVDRQQWREFVRLLKVGDLFPGIQGVGWSVHIPPDELTDHIRSIRSEGFPVYHIRPAGKRSSYTSIVYLEPFEKRNLRAFGYDMFSEPVRRAAMEQARDSGAGVLSGKVKLVQETDQRPQAGCLLYWPVYKKNWPTQTVEERRQAIQGYVYAPFRMDDLMKGILGDMGEMIDLHIYDGDHPTEDALMFDSDGILRDSNVKDTPFVRQEQLVIAQHQWTLVFHGTPAFLSSRDKDKPIYVLVSGLFSSLLLFGFVWMINQSRRHALALAKQMTLDLTASEERNRAIIQVSVNGVIVIDAQGIIESFNPAAEKMFGYREDEIKGKNVSSLMPEPYRSQHDGYLHNYCQTRIAKIIGVGRE